MVGSDIETSTFNGLDREWTGISRTRAVGWLVFWILHGSLLEGVGLRDSWREESRKCEERLLERSLI